MSKPAKGYKHKRLSLIHQTDLACAEQIISSQKMLPGAKGLYGAGIYFANTIEATDLKAHKRGVYLIADVYLGKYTKISKQEALSGHFNVQKIQSDGYTSIFGYKMPTGREIIVFDPERVKNIKYIYGARPKAVFTTDRERITLFFVTSCQNASQIVESQRIPKIRGPCGNGYYMFDTITDAKNTNIVNDAKETYLAADVHMKKYMSLDNGDVIEAHGNHKSFKANVGGMNVFILKESKLIEHIHYCGGKPWSKV